MKSDEEMATELRGYFAECEPTAHEVSTARARLEAHMARAAAPEGIGSTEPVVGRGRTWVRRIAFAALGALTSVVKMAVPLIAGLVVFVALAPTGGDDAGPPQCWSALGYGVPCWSGLSIGAAAVTVGVIGWMLWVKSRRRRYRR